MGFRGLGFRVLACGGLFEYLKFGERVRRNLGGRSVQLNTTSVPKPSSSETPRVEMHDKATFVVIPPVPVDAVFLLHTPCYFCQILLSNLSLPNCRIPSVVLFELYPSCSPTKTGGFRMGVPSWGLWGVPDFVNP